MLPYVQKNKVSELQQALVDKLKRQGDIQSLAVEKAFRNVPRHLFVSHISIKEAYKNQAVPTKLDAQGTEWISSASQPTMVAIMLEQLALEKGHKVLEIGAGTGYNAALMAHIVGDYGYVVSLDIDEDIVDVARENLLKANVKNTKLIQADGAYGYTENAPYDRIILTVAANDILPAWWEQLKLKGRLLLPLSLGSELLQSSTAFIKHEDYLLSLSQTGCQFMGLRGAFNFEDHQISANKNLLDKLKKHLPSKIHVYPKDKENTDLSEENLILQTPHNKFFFDF